MRDKDRCICCTHSATYKHYISLTLSPHAHTNVHRHTHAENESPLHLQHSDHSWALTFSHASNVFTKVQTGRTRLSLFLSCNPLVNKDADQNKKIKQQQGKKKRRSVLSFFFFTVTNHSIPACFFLPFSRLWAATFVSLHVRVVKRTSDGFSEEWSIRNKQIFHESTMSRWYHTQQWEEEEKLLLFREIRSHCSRF